MTDGGVSGLVSWELATSGFQLSYVFIKDGAGSRTGPFLYRLYGVTPDEFVNSLGDQFVTVNGIRKITYIAFYGVPGSPVPEGGVTLILFGLGLGAIERADPVSVAARPLKPGSRLWHLFADCTGPLGQKPSSPGWSSRPIYRSTDLRGGC